MSSLPRRFFLETRAMAKNRMMLAGMVVILGLCGISWAQQGPGNFGPPGGGGGGGGPGNFDPDMGGGMGGAGGRGGGGGFGPGGQGGPGGPGMMGMGGGPGGGGQMGLAGLQQQLEATNEEWKVLGPMLQKLMFARQQLDATAM